MGNPFGSATCLYTVRLPWGTLSSGNSPMVKIAGVAVVTKEGNRDAEVVASRLTEVLTRSGLQVVTVEPFKMQGVKQVAGSEVSSIGVDCAVAVGGDGTVLRTLRLFDNDTPVLGINVGGRGILAEAKPDQMYEVVERIKDGRFILERRLRLAVAIASKVCPAAANEVYVRRVSATKTPTYRIAVNGVRSFEQRMDGVIIATPTGSTAHSLSAGGPVVSSDLEVVLITPVCPIFRLPPVVVSAGVVEVSANQPTNLVIDGHGVFPVEAETPVVFSRHSSPAAFIRFDERPLRQLSNLGFK